jgi:hypothetical protein
MPHPQPPSFCQQVVNVRPLSLKLLIVFIPMFPILLQLEALIAQATADVEVHAYSFKYRSW